MNADTPGIWSMVRIPALLTLAVTVVRLVGELQGWSEPLFRNNAPDAEGAVPAVVAIWWLVIVFGFAFGWRVRRTIGAPARLGKAFCLTILAFAVIFGGAAACKAAGLIVLPDPKVPAEPVGLAYGAGLLGVGTVLTLLGVGRAAVALLVYGILARIPILVITWFGVQNNWDTHFTKLPASVPPATGNELFMALALPQVFFWIPFTVIVGGLFACIGASVAGRGPTRI